MHFEPRHFRTKKQAEHLHVCVSRRSTCKDAACSPHVYSRAIACAAKEQLWRSVPSCKDLQFTDCEAILCILMQQADNIWRCDHDGQAYMQTDAESTLLERIIQLNATLAR